MTEKIRLDFDSLTFSELEQIEEAIAPHTVSALDPKAVPIKVLVGLVWFAKHKADPTVTLDAVRAMKLDDIELDLTPAPDPTGAATRAT
jgi:hypothetical protein